MTVEVKFNFYMINLNFVIVESYLNFYWNFHYSFDFNIFNMKNFDCLD